jgi:hypothetical protein
MAELTNLSDLQAATNRNRLDFLQTDLGLCFTLADLSKTERETGDRDAARRVLEKAETGYATIARFLAAVENPDQKNHRNARRRRGSWTGRATRTGFVRLAAPFRANAVNR